MPNKKIDRMPRIYWDTCVFLTWIKDEQPPYRTSDEVSDLNDVVKLIDDGKIELYTSNITHTEICLTKLTDEQKQKYYDVFGAWNINHIGVVQAISRRAQIIRDACEQLKIAGDGLPSLGTPDAIHLATAVYINADEFHTFDNNDDPCEINGKPNKKRPQRGLIDLDKQIDDLPQISKPMTALMTKTFDFPD